MLIKAKHFDEQLTLKQEKGGLFTFHHEILLGLNQLKDCSLFDIDIF